MIPKAGCISTAIKVTQEARMSFYRRDCSPSKHKNFLCIVTNKGFFLWWWDDCTWSSLSPTVKAVTSEKIKHKKALYIDPACPYKKVLQPLCFISNQERECFRNEVYLKTSVLEAHISLITSLVWLWPCFRNVWWTVCCWKGEPVRWNARRNFPLIHPFWCCESYLLRKQLYSLYCAFFMY